MIEIVVEHMEVAQHEDNINIADNTNNFIHTVEIVGHFRSDEGGQQLPSATLIASGLVLIGYQIISWFSSKP